MDIMKRTLSFLCFIVFACLKVDAQQTPQFSQNMFNKLANNPGFAGSMEAICATALHRQQWIGFGDGRPVTTNLSVDAGIPSIFGGVGLNIVNETIGQYDNLGLQLSYAYRKELGNGQIGTGISLGVYEKLEKLGHSMEYCDLPHGGGQAIMLKDNGVLVGGSDPRKDGLALGY